MAIKVNQDKCIGCGLCVNICPQVFKLDAEGKSQVINDHDTDCARTAADSCPVEAITVE
jgi:ferredoxin